jgi:hypothetical protein
MYKNGKMRTIETIPGIGGAKENDGGGEFNYNIFKNFCKCSNVPLGQQYDNLKKPRLN